MVHPSCRLSEALQLLLQPFYGSLDYVRDNLGQPVPEGTFRHLLDFLVQNEDNTIWMDCHPIQTNWCPHLYHPHHFFYAGCLSLHNPPNLSWLGTGTKYAGLHTWWLGCQLSKAITKKSKTDTGMLVRAF